MRLYVCKKPALFVRSVIQRFIFHHLQNSRPCRSTISSNPQENAQIRNLQEDPQAQVGYKYFLDMQYYITVTLYTCGCVVVIFNNFFGFVLRL